MDYLGKMWKNRSFLRSLPWTLYFNFHYLPFKQAIKLPILLYKPDLLKMKGSVVLDAPLIKTGMIRMGSRNVSVYPNTGIMWENKGGKVTFKGSCRIGNNSFISVGKNGNLVFGDDFVSSSTIRIICYLNILFGEKTRVGWNSLFMDTNFHPLVNMVTGKKTPASGSITIGNYNWFGTGCSVMHDVTTPERCIFGIGSILTRRNSYESYCLHGGNPLQVLVKGIIRDYDAVREE